MPVATWFSPALIRDWTAEACQYVWEIKRLGLWEKETKRGELKVHFVHYLNIVGKSGRRGKKDNRRGKKWFHGLLGASWKLWTAFSNTQFNLFIFLKGVGFFSFVLDTSFKGWEKGNLYWVAVRGVQVTKWFWVEHVFFFLRLSI